MSQARDTSPSAEEPARARETLLRIAHKRIAAPRSSLTDLIGPRLDEVRPVDWLLPEEMSFGRYTELWEELGAEERLALNHWVYALTYSRIQNGERYVRAANETIAEFLDPHVPEVATLLRRESAEERDHIAAFDLSRAQVCRGLGLGGWRWPGKPLNGLASAPAAVRALLKTFGVDYVVAYFLGRGIANHMGKGFESPQARGDELCPATRDLALHHTLDESHHMAVSGLIAAAGPALVPGRRPRGALYGRLRQGLQRTMVRYTFGQELYKSHEARLSRLALERMPALAERSAAFRGELVTQHFASLSGLERSRNQVMPRPNRRLLDQAALPPEDRALWERELRAGQGNLRFFPEERGDAA
ncbi:MAG: hypothetical protein AB7N76_22040 [Planctomycetota bacterium]